MASRNRYAEVRIDHAGICLEISCGAMLPISRLSRCRATSSVPCLNSVPLKNGSSLKSPSMSFANIRIMSARMSLSENTAAKRRVGLACARAGKAHAAARAAPALSTERRLMLKSMLASSYEVWRWKFVR